MLAWSPLLIQKIEIHALGFVLRKLQLNRHRDAEVAAHGHDYAQLILYLTGEGVQTVNSRRRRAHAGDLFVIPARTPHGFSTVGHSRPLCLVLDYELEGHGRVRATHRTLSPATLNELHALLSRVPRKGRLTLTDYAAILAVVARLLGQAPAAPAPTVTLFERLSDRVRVPAPLGQIARELGYHPDHLSRKLKRESGLGLRTLRDRVRLETAEVALRSAATVADAATRCGFEDPNYFARWFRRQTGQTPSAWRG
ncbi:MAG: AraC family transcriptional regulator [Opitutaceae bacterium]|nr:AraC family transcriptional regulator [Opitutaceae bacterium]